MEFNSNNWKDNISKNIENSQNDKLSIMKYY